MAQPTRKLSDVAARVGTAGWSIPARYAEDMPRGGSHLERYAKRLNAVEINTSFYRPHQRKTYEKWARSTPPQFSFSVKVPKVITHELRLRDCDDLINRFLAEVAGLGDKLGVLLIQLPPNFAFEKRSAGRFFRYLRKRTESATVLEARHQSWFAPDVDAWLADLHIARVAADPAPAAEARQPGGWDGIAYYRWHGSPRIYYSDYDAAALSSLERELTDRWLRNAPTWCIFDNTASGAALGNALELASHGRPPINKTT